MANHYRIDNTSRMARSKVDRPVMDVVLNWNGDCDQKHTEQLHKDLNREDLDNTELGSDWLINNPTVVFYSDFPTEILEHADVLSFELERIFKDCLQLFEDKHSTMIMLDLRDVEWPWSYVQTKDMVNEVRSRFAPGYMVGFVFSEPPVSDYSLFDDMVDFLDTTYPMKHSIVPCLIGAVGIGKTQAVLQHAKNVGAGKVVTIIASQVLPNEVSGITMPDDRTQSMTIYDHARLSSLEDGDILFFDELLEADQMVLSACLTLIESRQMMSGRKLPDIQIVAATNPTIKPTMLKENIRQRFMFRNFETNRDTLYNYIERRFNGFRLPTNIPVESTSNEYNILSPRTITKLVEWICSTEDEIEINHIAGMIDLMFSRKVGTLLAGARHRQLHTNYDEKAKHQIYTALVNNNFPVDLEEDWENITPAELMKSLSSRKDWDDIRKVLEKEALKL